MAVINILLPRVLYHPQIAEAFNLGMLREIRAYRCSIFARARHTQLQRLKAAQQHPRGIGIADCADGIAHHPDWIEPRFRAEHAARDQIAMPACIFGERVNDQVRPVAQRL